MTTIEESRTLSVYSPGYQEAEARSTKPEQRPDSETKPRQGSPLLDSARANCEKVLTRAHDSAYLAYLEKQDDDEWIEYDKIFGPPASHRPGGSQ